MAQNRHSISFFSFLMTHVVSLVLLCSVSFAQDENKPPVEEVPKLIDEFELVTEGSFRGRMDSFLIELQENPDHQGYIINYLAADTFPGDRKRHPRENMIANHISFRRFGDHRITLVRGGYRKNLTTELWIVPRGAKPPKPSKTVPEPEIPLTGPLLYAQRDVADGDGSSLPEHFVLISVKEKERRELEEDVTGDEEFETPLDDHDEEFILKRLDVDITEAPAERKRDRFVLRYYADDQYYDIGKLSLLMDKARLRFAEHNDISLEKVSIEYGGYKNFVEVEIWGVPENDDLPMPTPDKRESDDISEDTF